MSRASTGPWIGALLRGAWKAVRDHISDAVKEAGYVDVNRSHVSLFRHPGLDGTRPTQLADEMQISKQAVNDLLRDLERLGYIRRDVDPSDKRSRLIRLTPKGIELEDAIRLAAREAETRLERELGPKAFGSFRAALIEAPRALNGQRNEAGKP
jgi:DNA-binding MarR family transcriptional regulator